MRIRFVAGWLATAFASGLLVAAGPTAQAGSKGRKNTALVLGAVAVQQLLSKKTTNGLIAGAGAAYAYKKYRDKRKEEQHRAGATAYGTPHRSAGRASAPYQQRNHQGRPVAWVDGRPIWTRDDYIDERTGQRSGDVQAPGTPFQRYDYGAAARAEAYRNSIYGQAEANQNCPPRQRRR
jgi:hypothetical protein